MERTRFTTPEKTIKVTGTASIKSGKLIIKLELNEKILQPLYIIKSELNRKSVRQLYINREKITLLDTNAKSKLTKRIRNVKYLPLAKQLAKTIQTKKNIKHTPSQITQWTNEIRLLSEQNEIEYTRIEKVLDWYEDHIGEDYVPVIESGYSLKTKFMRLEDAMNRKFSNGKKPFIKDDNIRYDLCPDGKYRTPSGTLYIE